MDNTKRFSGKADIYAKARPAYAAGALAYLSSLGLCAGTAVADVGAGTGIFSHQLLDLGCTVYAVEPNADMRSQMMPHPRLHLIDAPAEHTPLPDHSVQVVTAAQAFHWFDPAAFRTECRRILKPGGFVALLWNHRVESSPLVRDYDQIYRRYNPAFHGHSNGLQADDTRFWVFFNQFQIHTFDNDLLYDRSAFVTRALSSSYAPRAAEPAYRTFIADMNALFDQYAKDGILTMPNQTMIYTGTVTY